MLSEVRALVATQDQEVYDGLVLCREREAHRAWHGGLGSYHPQAHCGHEASDGHVHFAKVWALVIPIFTEQPHSVYPPS